MRPSPSKATIAERKAEAARVAMADALEQSDALGSAKPEPGEYGLPDDFSITAFSTFMEKRDRQTLVSKVVAFVALLLVLLILSRDRAENGDILLGYLGPLAVSYLAVFVLPVSDYVLKATFGDAAYIEAAQDFRTASSHWQFYETTCGEGFWRALRGTALEHAAARLFRDRGWQVATTATTGDGGIDLVLTFSKGKFFCQCKGHAKPVSVAAVREIAGVCAASDASPMLIVVNGITGPARKEAQNLAVAVWDSRELASFARGELSLN